MTIVFQSIRDGEWATYAVDPEGGRPMRVAPNDGPSLGTGVPSPDGRAFVVPGYAELRVVRAGEAGSTRVASGAPGTAAWSPDGRRIVFNGLAQGLSIVDADGRNGRRLTQNIGDSDAAWSPDGEWIAFTRDGGGGVWVMDPRGERRRRVWAEGDYASQLRWSEDGKRLSFLTGNTGGVVVTVSVATGETLSRVDGVDPYSPLAWSPDGRRIAWQRDYETIRVMRSDGSERRIVAKGSQPAWSPDGRSIAYVGPDQQLWSIGVDGRGQRRFTRPFPNGGYVLAPGWMRGPLREAPSPYRTSTFQRRDGAVLVSPYPVESLGAAGSRVVLAAPPRVWTPIWVVPPPLILWDAESGTVSRVTRFRCSDTASSLVVLRDRVAFDCAGGHAASYGRSVDVFRGARPRPISIAYGLVGEGCDRSQLPGTIAGAGDLLVFSRTPVRCWERTDAPRTLWRVQGSRKQLVATGPDASEPTAVDDGRILVERDDGIVTLLRPDGTVLGRVDPGLPLPKRHLMAARRPTAGLVGPRLAVVRGRWLRLFDASSLRPLRTWLVPRGAAFAGIAGGLVAYVAGTTVHVRRLSDGRLTILRPPGRDVAARITTAGLFYAVHERSVGDYEAADAARNPARVVFVRRDALLRRFRTSR